MAFLYYHLPASPWIEDGLFECFNDFQTCFLTLLFPCATYADNGRLLYEVDDARCIKDCLFFWRVALLPGCACYLGMLRRNEIRRKYNLPEEPCGDCCVHCCCQPCALCQENRELKARFELSVRESLHHQGVPATQTKPSTQYTTTPPQITKVQG
eukprot:g6866.t1